MQTAHDAGAMSSPPYGVPHHPTTGVECESYGVLLDAGSCGTLSPSPSVAHCPASSGLSSAADPEAHMGEMCERQAPSPSGQEAGAHAHEDLAAWGHAGAPDTAEDWALLEEWIEAGR